MDMIKTFTFIIIFVWCLIPSQKLWAQTTPPEVKEQVIQLNQCHDKTLRVRFLCNPDWELEEDKETILIIISQNPAVTLTITRIKTEAVFLEELTPEILQEMGQYADGFSSSKTEISGQEALVVDGHYDSDENVRMRDYYILHKKKLYGILFSVNPPSSFLDYEVLLDKIIRNFEFF